MKKRVVNRQNYSKKFMFITGSYFSSREISFLKIKNFNSKSYPYKIDRINFIDIDDKFI